MSQTPQEFAADMLAQNYLSQEEYDQEIARLNGDDGSVPETLDYVEADIEGIEAAPSDIILDADIEAIEAIEPIIDTEGADEGLIESVVGEIVQTEHRAAVYADQTSTVEIVEIVETGVEDAIVPIATLVKAVKTPRAAKSASASKTPRAPKVPLSGTVKLTTGGDDIDALTAASAFSQKKVTEKAAQLVGYLKGPVKLSCFTEQALAHVLSGGKADLKGAVLCFRNPGLKRGGLNYDNGTIQSQAGQIAVLFKGLLIVDHEGNARKDSTILAKFRAERGV